MMENWPLVCISQSKGDLNEMVLLTAGVVSTSALALASANGRQRCRV